MVWDFLVNRVNSNRPFRRNFHWTLVVFCRSEARRDFVLRRASLVRSMHNKVVQSHIG